MFNLKSTDMKKYIEPTIKVKKIELEDMIAASPGAEKELDKTTDLEGDAVESKKYGNVSFWDDDDDDIATK